MNTIEMYGMLQGISGSAALEHIETLELLEEIEGDDENDD